MLVLLMSTYCTLKLYNYIYIYIRTGNSALHEAVTRGMEGKDAIKSLLRYNYNNYDEIGIILPT